MTDDGRSEYLRTLVDPIHGVIHLSNDELSAVDHPLFRRLHRIRQNGLLHFVFPASNHTRFEHSIGTVFTAQSILDNLYRNSRVAAEKRISAVNSLNDADIGEAIDFSTVPTEACARTERIARLAALVHDLGHGPFSHHFDAFAPPTRVIRRLLAECGALSPISGIQEFIEDDGERINHEVMSCILFTKIWMDLGRDPADIQDVAAVLLGESQLASNGEIKALLPLAHDIVASAPADADRMDYLLRDSKSNGVTYGLYDQGRLLKSFLPYVTEDSEKRREIRLGIKKSGLRAVENFVQARFELFVQVYYHKTNRAIQLMLFKIAGSARDAGVVPFEWAKCDDLNDLADIYRELSDERFLNVLRNCDSHWPLKNRVVNDLANAINMRRVWKRVYEGERAEEVAVKLECDTDYEILLDAGLDPQATKDLDEGASILVRTLDGVYQIQRNATWTSESPLIDALHKHERELKRVYLASPRDEDVKKCRKIVWRHLGELP